MSSETLAHLLKFFGTVYLTTIVLQYIGTKEELRFGGDGYEGYKNGKMKGTIPDSFYNLMHLKQFSITNHALEGQIKSEIGNLKNLTHLDLMGTKLTGTLPSELGLCEKLGKPAYKSIFQFETSRELIERQCTKIIPFII